MGKQSSCDVRNVLHFNDGRVVTEGLETVMGFGETCNTYLEHLVLRMRLERAGLNQGFQGENGRNLYFFFSISTWLSTGTFFSSRYVQPGFGRDSFPVPLAHAGRPQRQTKRNVLLKRLQLYGQLVSRTRARYFLTVFSYILSLRIRGRQSRHARPVRIGSGVDLDEVVAACGAPLWVGAGACAGWGWC